MTAIIITSNNFFSISSSGVLAASANLASQQIAGCKQINHDSIVAYGLFG